MMHCTMEDLLALRANEGSVWGREHLDACPACRAELEALYQRVAQLKALPPIGPARDRWPVIRDRVVGARARGRRLWVARGLAAAALIAGVAVFRPFGGTPAYAEELERAKRQSASLETELQRYDPDSRVVSGRAASAAAELEDRIATVDGWLAQLNAAPAGPDPQLVKLWQDRVNLMQQLVDVHVTSAAYVGL
jgi:hypothetical protein